MTLKKMAWRSTLVFLAFMISWRFLDSWLALAAQKLLSSNGLLRAGTANIPDILLPLTCFGSCLLWANYFRLRHKGVINRQRHFSRLAGSAVPLAYFLKWLFKYVFGRINTRVWLANPADNGFHWLQGGGEYSSFPSGHMAVFAAFFTALWLFYPRLRTLSIWLLLALAVALIATNYHFLSDVIAGALLGLTATFLLRNCCGFKPAP